MKTDNLAKKIKAARVSKGLSQQELAVILDLSEKTISAYEKSRALPPLPTLEKIARATDKTLQFFSESDGSGSDKLEEISSKLDIIIKELRKLHNGRT